MSTVQNGAFPIHYEIDGTGTPVLFIPGMAARSEWFAYNIPAFAQHHRVIAQDLRGSHRDGIPAAPGPYTTRDMASDSIAILDDLDVGRAHIVALSMGGMVAQWLAIDHPQRVERLSIVSNGLAATPSYIAEAAKDAAASDQAVSTAAQRRDTALRFTFTEAFPATQPEKWRYYLNHIDANQPRPDTLRAQVAASLEHDTRALLPSVPHRIQLLVGELDSINATYAPELAEALPHGDLTLLPGMHHGLNLEFASEYNERVLTFLNTQ